ncbi:MAG: YicC family protein [Phycisphaerales bacterium]|nr:YicC family protein [Phycisphaerales bacterium]
MIRSMTGFGEGALQDGDVHYFLEIRSLNSKYFKAVIRLPDEFQALEAEIESELRRRLTRGSVFLTARCTDTSGEAAYDINVSALGRYIDQIKRTPQLSGGAGGASELKFDLAALLTLPGVLQPPANEEQRLERARAALLKLVITACGRLVAMREREGKMLLDDLIFHREEIADRLRRIGGRATSVVIDYERRLRTRIENMVKEAGLTVEQVDIVRELAICAEKSDISEEITRLTGHIGQFTELLGRNDSERPVGRTLDFLSQEMLREANTIASKCADAEVSRWTVEIKGSIDRIKEQVQNVE